MLRACLPALLFALLTPFLLMACDRGAPDAGLCTDRCGDGQCQEMVCLGSGCPCAETTESCPQDCAAAVSSAATPQPEPAVTPPVFELVVQDGSLVSGPKVLRVAQGDQLTIRVTADAAEEFHLHGYDLKLDLEPGVPAELNLTAEHSGRFEYELHRAHLELGALEVMPR